MNFNTILEEKRVFKRFKWCLKELLNVEINGVHLSVIDPYSPFDFHTSIKYNGWTKIGLTEIRFTNNNLFEEQESFISLNKKIKEIDPNIKRNHRIFIGEHSEGLYIANLMKAVWTKVDSSRFSEKACYFDKNLTPHLIIPLRRNDMIRTSLAFDLKEPLVREYGNIRSARGILMNMTDSI